jgi:hypothetical protein
MGVKWDTLKAITTQVKNSLEDMGMTTTSETSKYPSSVSIMSIVDENDTPSLSMLGIKKYWSSTMFIHISTKLGSNSTKQEAITLGYKILGLE